MTRATHQIDGRRATPPSGPARDKTFVVASAPAAGTAFENHANEFAQKTKHSTDPQIPDEWIFRAPLKGERIEFDRQGSLELREWNGRRWRQVEDSTAIDDVPANATRAELSTAVNAMLAALRKADVIDDPTPSLGAGE